MLFSAFDLVFGLNNIFGCSISLARNPDICWGLIDSGSDAPVRPFFMFKCGIV